MDVLDINHLFSIRLFRLVTVGLRGDGDYVWLMIARSSNTTSMMFAHGVNVAGSVRILGEWNRPTSCIFTRPIPLYLADRQSSEGCEHA